MHLAFRALKISRADESQAAGPAAWLLLPTPQRPFIPQGPPILRKAPATALVLLFLCCTNSLSGGPLSSLIRGTVYHREGGKSIWLAGARVIASSTRGPQILAVTKTDTRGRYQFADLPNGLPNGKIKLAVARTGYYTVRIAGLDRSTLVVDCSVQDACSQIDFELARAGVVAGRVVDELGEPLQQVEVSLARADTGPGGGQQTSHRDETDDRGEFRIADLKPGDYTLGAEEAFPAYPHGVSYHAESRKLEIEEGTEIRGLRLIMQRSERFRVSGSVRGIDRTEGGKFKLEAIPVSDGSVGAALTWERAVKLGDSGQFVFWQLPSGTYAFQLEPGSSEGSSRAARTLRLGTVSVERHLNGLVLEPIRYGSVEGVVRVDAEARNQNINLLLTSRKTGEGKLVGVRPPNYMFSVNNVVPGDYEVSLLLGNFYIEAVKSEGKLQSGASVRVRQGEDLAIEVLLSSSFGRIHGRLKQPRRLGQEEIRAASHFRVALAAEGGIRSVQADQHGSFAFDKVPPGQYRICAWRQASEEAVHDEELWEQAGSAVRAFPVDPDSEIELELTAVP